MRDSTFTFFVGVNYLFHYYICTYLNKKNMAGQLNDPRHPVRKHFLRAASSLTSINALYIHPFSFPFTAFLFQQCSRYHFVYVMDVTIGVQNKEYNVTTS